MTIFLSDLRAAVRQRADMVNSQFIPDGSINVFINASCGELYDLVIETYQDYNITVSQFTIATGNTQPLPVDFYKMAKLRRQLSGPNDFMPVRPFQLTELDDMNRQIVRTMYGRFNVSYRMVGTNLYIAPLDQAPGNYELWYIPQWGDLQIDTDALPSFMSFSNWQEYIVTDAAIKCLQTEESDTSVLQMQKEQLKHRILAAAGTRDAGETSRVGDVTSYAWYNNFSPFGR